MPSFGIDDYGSGALRPRSSNAVQDFDSAALKHKKHWNSFTTSFFTSVHEATTQLQVEGGIKIDVSRAEALLKQDLRCHVCNSGIKNMPLLKAHIRSCKQQL